MRLNPWCGGASSAVRVFGEEIEHEKRGNLFRHRALWWEICLPNKSDHDSVGPCHRAGTRLKAHQLQGLPSVSEGAARAGCVPQGESLHWADTPLEVPDGLARLLHQEEGWLSPARPRLPRAECCNSEEPVPVRGQPLLRFRFRFRSELRFLFRSFTFQFETPLCFCTSSAIPTLELPRK
jgi:hypothetical protein